MADTVPAVLGTRSEVFDLGRRTRCFTTAQHIAMTIRDQHCTEPGCDAPAWICHAHHDREWSAGGPTDLDNGPGYHPRT